MHSFYKYIMVSDKTATDVNTVYLVKYGIATNTSTSQSYMNYESKRVIYTGGHETTLWVDKAHSTTYIVDKKADSIYYFIHGNATDTTQPTLLYSSCAKLVCQPGFVTGDPSKNELYWVNT